MNTGSMSAKTACDVAVIGGGAAGMMAALQAAWAGARVALLEKNEKLGKKIYITGKGRCNVTNVADIDDFFKQIPRNPRFLNAAARQFTHEDVTGLLEMLGTPTKVERGGRVFPESDKASDVTRALDRGMRDAGVVISLNTQVAHVRQAEGGFDVELTQGGTLRAKSGAVVTPAKLRLMRRLVRDRLFRGSDVDNTLERYLSVSRGERSHITPFSLNAEERINTFLPYEFAVYGGLLRDVVEKLPEDIAELVREISPVPASVSPIDSLVREVCGGSIYEY